MNLDQVILNLIEAQNSHDSKTYADCFTNTATVHDEGKTYSGKSEIRQWIQNSNKKYNAMMKPINYTGSDAGNLLTAEVTGNFPGSPVILKYHISLESGLVNSLQITV